MNTDFVPIGHAEEQQAARSGEPLHHVLARRVVELRKKKTDLAADLKGVNAELGNLEEQLVGAMVEARSTNFRLDDLDLKFHIARTVRASAKADRKEELIMALDENGFANYAGRAVNASSLASLCRDLLEHSDSDRLPEWLEPLVNLHTVPDLRVGKA